MGQLVMWVEALVDKRQLVVQWQLAASSAKLHTACAVHSRLGPEAGWGWLWQGLEAWWLVVCCLWG